MVYATVTFQRCFIVQPSQIYNHFIFQLLDENSQLIQVNNLLNQFVYFFYMY